MLRVIAGALRSRLLTAPRGGSTRPTSDRLRETLFNVIAGRVPGSTFVDLFAGSGAVGIEAASRGASSVWFAEQDRSALLALRKNLQDLRVDALGITVTVDTGGVASCLQRLVRSRVSANLVFLDPPYEAEDEYTSTLAWLGGAGATIFPADALVIAEHRAKTPLAPSYGVLERTRVLKQGDAALSFFARAQQDKTQPDE